MKKLNILIIMLLALSSFSQTGTEFWFAPPNVTDDHQYSERNDVYLNITCLDQDATVHISQPANPSFLVIEINLTANTSQKIYLGDNIADLETKPTNTVLNTGLLIESTERISAYYEYDNSHNADIFALKGANALGEEFYIPLHNYEEYDNHLFTDIAYASFDIVATEDDTEVRIYPAREVDGHPAQQQFIITLNRGQTYSCAWTGTGYREPSNHPYGSAVTSDKPIAISIKDDSNHGVTGCYDLLGDQIVPVNIVGDEYIVVKGQLSSDNNEGFFVLATQNNTDVIIYDGVTTTTTTLFAGEMYRYDISTDNQKYTYVKTSDPVYLTHTTGFGCEIGQALLPPLNCAGSEEISFVRSTNEGFFITLLVKSTSVGNFTITPISAQAKINSATWTVVPGTLGEWSATTIQFNNSQIPVGVACRLSNSSNIFAMGLINGGSSSGCRYGYFSEYVSEINSDAGADLTICANTTATLNGSVTGGSTTGLWSSSGSGSFSDATDFNAIYTPSFADITSGSVTLTLNSTGLCFPTSDDMILNFDPAPTVDAGPNQTICANNAITSLGGFVTVASGGQWSTVGDGSFNDINNLNADYTPGATDITNGNVKLYLTTTGNGFCVAELDSLTITITPAPTINAGIDQTVCANNAQIDLNAIATIATGGQWSGGAGSYNPGDGALNTFYMPSGPEIANGSLTLTVTTTGNGTCQAVSDNITLNFSPSPIVNAGIDQTKCSNNEITTLNATISGGASTGIWSNGLGTFFVNDNDLQASYTPTPTELANGSVSLTLTSTDHASNGCMPESDQMTILFTAKPTANAGPDQTVCANNAVVDLNGTISIASGAIWSTSGSGNFASSTALSTNYTPSASDITEGTLKLYLSTTGNDICNQVKDSLLLKITPAPTLNAGVDQTVCANNAQLELNAIATIATGGQWSGGAGSYNPGDGALNTFYMPSAPEIANGSLTLTVTSTGNGTCLAVSDDIILNFTPAPIVNAGNDQTKCSNNEVTILNANISGGASTGTWSNGSGTFFVNNNDLQASYTPTPIEIANGSVSLTLTSSDHASNGCNAENDQMTISFTPAPTIDAGPDVTVCANNANVALEGTVTVSPSAIWSSTGTGSFGNSTALSTNYTPSAADKALGSVKIYLSSTNNASCTEVKDSLMLSITPAPTINAGLDQTVCSNNADINLNAIATIATGGDWTGGSGSYSPSDNALNTIYTPTLPEISSGFVSLIVTSTNNGDCLAVSDEITINFSPSPEVSAGSDQTVCANNQITNLNGSISGGANTGVWSNGLGTFLVDPNDLNASYTPTTNEIANGSVTLTLSTTDHADNQCLSVNDQMTISFTPAPTIDAGSDVTVCANNANVALEGTVTVSPTAIWSSTGTGSFGNITTLITNYTPSAADKALGLIKIYLTSTGNASCTEVKDSLMLSITPAPTIDAGLDQTVCANNAEINLKAIATIATGGDWTGNAESYSPGPNTLNTNYQPSTPEITNGSLTLTVTSTGNGDCLAVSDDVTITFSPSPEVNAGSDQIKCSNNEITLLSGSVSGGASTGTWSNGLGTFLVDPNDLNATYTPTATEIANNAVTLTLSSSNHADQGCNMETDQMTISFLPSPTVDAGLDVEVCQNNANATITGAVSIASGGIWSGGSGSFSPSSTDLDAIYIPSASEALTGSPITLSLTTTGNGTCNAVNDQMMVEFDPSPIVNAGAPQSACENNPVVTLQGSVVNATGGLWSGSEGSFSPSNTGLLATFTPSATDIANGGVDLTLSSIDNGNCNEETDIFSLNILPAPIVNAGQDASYCANNATISLTGTVDNALGGSWSGGLGIFGDPNALVTTYQPSEGEILSGSLSLFLTSTGNASCNAVQDEVVYSFTTAPTSDAGIDQTVCANNSNIDLSGAITISGGATWSGGLGTFLPNANDLNATYQPTAAEISAQSVSLSLTTTGNSLCLAVTDIMDVAINPAPIVNAGVDIHTCYNNAEANLNGNVINAVGGIWTGGSGSFSPDNTALNASYTPTVSEIDNGQIKLYLSSTGNGTCNVVVDSLLIIIDPAPIVSAGLDQTVCGNNAETVLNGSISLASGGVWSGGLGLYSPNNSVLNATYTPTETDINNGMIELILTSTGNGSCLAVEDQMIINFTPTPTIDAGLDFEVCANNSEIELTGIVTESAGGQWSGGAGTYNPNNSSLSTTYQPTPTEIDNGTIMLSISSTGNGTCNAVTDNINVTINPSPIVNAGTDINVCVDDLTATLNGSVSGITNTGSWNTSGTGTFVPNANSLNAAYICSAADSLVGMVTLTLTSTNNDVCSSVSDDLTIYILPAGIVDAGLDRTVCANNAIVGLEGSVSGGTTTGTWSTDGSGVFIPNETDLNATYIPSNTDTANGTVVLTLTANSCNNAESSITITITAAPNVYAGLDQTVCVDDLDIQMDALISGASSTGIWSSNGTGTFDPNNTTTNAIYHASALDSINQNVTLILEATSIGNCSVVRDTVHIDILPAGVVNAGQDQVLCSNNANIQLGGILSGGASEGQWATSGSGIFLPNVNDLNAAYAPSEADLITGTVTLVLSATNSCNFAFDALSINFTPAPTTNAGTDATVCGNNAELDLSGSYTISAGADWSSNGTGVFTPSLDNMNATYTPSAADISNGDLLIFLSSTGNGTCNAVVDTLELVITPAPDVDAGIDQNVCSTADGTQLLGYITGTTTTGEWSTLGFGSFTDPEVLNTNYEFNASDVTTGSVKLVLSSTNNGNCALETDTMNITFGNTTFAYAGLDQELCSDDLSLDVTGIVSGGTTSGTWTSLGTGEFTPDADQLSSTYTCSAQDSVYGSVELILTTTNNGGCLAGTDTLLANINYLPIISAGTDIEVCKGIDSVALGGSAQFTEGLQWSTTGSGSFVPNNTALNIYYLPSSADTINGTVEIFLSSTDNIFCSEQTDASLITFSVPLEVDFSSNLACLNQGVMFDDNSDIYAGIITDWTWDYGDGSVGTGENSEHAYTTTGNFNVNLEVVSSLGCSYSKTKEITVYPDPTPDFEFSTACYLDEVSFTDLSSVSTGDIVAWQWIFEAGDTAHTENPTHLFDQSGSFDINLKVTSSQGCVGSTVQTIEVHPKPNTDFTYLYHCANSSIVFTDASSAAGNAISFWTWDFGDGQSSAEQNPNHQFENQGEQSISLISGSTPNCADTLEMNVYMNSIKADFSFIEKCLYDSISFTNLSDLNGDTEVTYSWNFGDDNTSIESNPKHKFFSAGSYQVELIINSDGGCVDTLKKVTEVYPTPVSNFDFMADEFIEDSPITFTDQSIDAMSWLWNFGDGASSSIANPTHVYKEGNNYLIQQITTNTYQCVDTASTNLIIEIGERILPPKLPTAFSPNGDQMNDIFYPRGGPFKSVEFRIYNAWGQEIFSTSELGAGWDGTYKGEDQQIGVYVWSISATTEDGKPYTKTGDVTLIR